MSPVGSSTIETSILVYSAIITCSVSGVLILATLSLAISLGYKSEDELVKSYETPIVETPIVETRQRNLSVSDFTATAEIKPHNNNERVQPIRQQHPTIQQRESTDQRLTAIPEVSRCKKELIISTNEGPTYSASSIFSSRHPFNSTPVNWPSRPEDSGDDSLIPIVDEDDSGSEKLRKSVLMEIDRVKNALSISDS